MSNLEGGISMGVSTQACGRAAPLANTTMLKLLGRQSSVMSPTTAAYTRTGSILGGATSIGLGRNRSMLSKTQCSSAIAAPNNKKLQGKKASKAPTIAQNIRDKEKKDQNEYVHSLHNCPMDMPPGIYFSSSSDDIE